MDKPRSEKPLSSFDCARKLAALRMTEVFPGNAILPEGVSQVLSGCWQVEDGVDELGGRLVAVQRNAERHEPSLEHYVRRVMTGDERCSQLLGTYLLKVTVRFSPLMVTGFWPGAVTTSLALPA